MKKEEYTISWLYDTLEDFYVKNGVMEKENFTKNYYSYRRGIILEHIKNSQPYSPDEKKFIYDFAWDTFNYILQHIQNQQIDQLISDEDFYQKRKNIMMEWTLFVRRYFDKTANELYKEYLLTELLLNQLKAKNTNLATNAIIISTSHCCEYCKSLNGNKIHIDLAVESEPLNCDLCTNSYGCTCTYGFQHERNDYGRLVKYFKP